MGIAFMKKLFDWRELVVAIVAALGIFLIAGALGAKLTGGSTFIIVIVGVGIARAYRSFWLDARKHD
jgi:hypothetical protein